MKQLKLLLTLYLLYQTAHCAKAQHWLGAASSNYAGTNSVYANAANVVDSRHKVYLNLAAHDFSLLTNYITWNAPYSLMGVVTNSVGPQYRSDRGLIIFKDSYWQERLNGKPKRFHTGGDLRGPALLVSLKQNKIGVAISTRGRYFLNLTDVSEPIARLMNLGTDRPDFQNVKYTDQRATLNVNGYIETGLSVGAVIVDDQEYFFKVGATLKRLTGMYNAHARVEDADIEVLVERDNPQREVIQAYNLKASYGYTTEGSFDSFAPTPAFLFGRQAAGAGWGVDLGVVFEYRPNIKKLSFRDKKRGGLIGDVTKNKYKFKIGAALNDLGAIRYNNPAYVNQYNVDQRDVVFSYRLFNNIKSSNGAITALNRTLGVRPENKTTAFSSGLPTTLNLSFDYLWKNNLYLSAVWIQNLRTATSLAMQQPSVLAVVPRWERKWGEVSAPISLIDNYSALTVGLAGRFGPLWVGSDNILGTLSLLSSRGLDIFFGLSVPIFHTRTLKPLSCPVPMAQPSRRKRRF